MSPECQQIFAKSLPLLRRPRRSGRTLPLSRAGTSLAGSIPLSNRRHAGAGSRAFLRDLLPGDAAPVAFPWCRSICTRRSRLRRRRRLGGAISTRWREGTLSIGQTQLRAGWSENDESRKRARRLRPESTARSSKASSGARCAFAIGPPLPRTVTDDLDLKNSSRSRRPRLGQTPAGLPAGRCCRSNVAKRGGSNPAPSLAAGANRQVTLRSRNCHSSPATLRAICP